jgi:hypothetical protein
VYGNSFESYVVAIVVPDMEVFKKFLTAEHPGKSIEEAVQVCDTPRSRVSEGKPERKGQCDVQGARVRAGCQSFSVSVSVSVSLQPCVAVSVPVQRSSSSESGCMRVADSCSEEDDS